MKTTQERNCLDYQVSPDETHHLIGKTPAYTKRFFHVLKFHPPGVASVLDETGAYHINSLGEPIYSQRYTCTFGFYFECAAVSRQGEWFHILLDGAPLYSQRYQWCGNFQEAFCAVRDKLGFFHIDLTGKRPYPERYAYVGDFHDGAAVVQTEEGAQFHINPRGEPIHPYRFLDLDVYHKGFARAKDSEGWFHIDRLGRPIYREKYACIEPFYNGIARVETHWGALVLINQEGKVVQEIRKQTEDPFHRVSRDLVSYWKLFTLKTSQDLNLFDLLPSTLSLISDQTGLSSSTVEKILLALKEMHYVKESKEGWDVTNTGQLLTSSHPFSLKEAQDLWMMEHFTSWHGLLEALKKGQCAFERLYQIKWFDFLNQHPQKQALYHRALSQYAKRDYGEIVKRINCSSYQSLADIGGSTGTVLERFLTQYQHLHGHLLDLPTVIDQIKIEESVRRRVHLHPCDFFKRWPDLKVDAALLCRVIHDWDNKRALHILKQVWTLLKSSTSRLFVIESILDRETGKGGLLNLNMLVMTGGQERTFDAFSFLFKEAGFSIEFQEPLNEVSSIFALRPLK